MSAQLLDVPLDDLAPHPRNVRRDVGDVTELAESIAMLGILEPLLVAPNPHARQDRIDGDTEAPYVVIAGHRRLAAAQAAALAEVPCIVRDDLTTDVQVTLAMLVENLQRADLSPIEEATAYAQLELAGMTTKDMAKRTGRARSTIDARLRLLDLPDTVKDRVHDHQISLDEAATLGEFTETPDVVATLEKALGSNNWRWEVENARRRVKDNATRAAVTAALSDRGVRIIKVDFPTWQIGRDEHPEIEYLDRLGCTPRWMVGHTPTDDEDEPSGYEADIVWPDHADCPGHGVIIEGAGHVKWVCTEALTHRPGSGPSASTSTPTAGLRERDVTDSKAKAEREAFDAALETARTVRLEFLRPLVNGGPGKPLSKYQAAAVATHLVATLPTEEYYPQASAILDVLGDDYGDIDVDELDDRAATLLAASDPHRSLLAIVAGVEEEQTDNAWAWHVGYQLAARRRWFTLLESIGYQASDFELSLIAPKVDQVVEDVVTDLADYDEHHGGDE